MFGDFGSGGRYHYLDSLSGKTVDPGDDPRRRWEEIELELIQKRPNADQAFESMDLRAVAAFEIGWRLKRFARAVGRMWAWGVLGEEGQKHYGVISTIARPDDDELGGGYPTT